MVHNIVSTTFTQDLSQRTGRGYVCFMHDGASPHRAQDSTEVL